MTSWLYAEVYLVCMLVVGILLFWSVRRGGGSELERWLTRTLTGFFLNFSSNFGFTVFRILFAGSPVLYPCLLLLKTCYHVSLCLSVFCFCGYAGMVLEKDLLRNSRLRNLLILLSGLPVLAALVNPFTGHLFVIGENGEYSRKILFQGEMACLVTASCLVSVDLLAARRREGDPERRSLLLLSASFPACLLAAWALSFSGESVPVIGVSIMVELLCLYMGTVHQQISLDKLTQVNNRHNLMGFLRYRVKNHGEDLWLLMMDVDHFKQINDTYGHLMGDRALVRVAQCLKRACTPCRTRPYIARFGGDEFIIVLEGSEEEVDGLKSGIDRELSLPDPGLGEIPLRMSIGAARYQEEMTPKELLEAADRMLYETKKKRNTLRR